MQRGNPGVLLAVSGLGVVDWDALTVTGKKVGAKPEERRPAFSSRRDPPPGKPLLPEGGLAILRGNLAPDGRW
jgi:dihydroxyacid dehydratase/phosphogluconate dehydratase